MKNFQACGHRAYHILFTPSTVFPYRKYLIIPSETKGSQFGSPCHTGLRKQALHSQVLMIFFSQSMEGHPMHFMGLAVYL